MTEQKKTSWLKPFSRAAFFKRRGGLAAVFLVLFLLGYNVTVGSLQTSRAQVVTPPTPVSGHPRSPVIGSYCPTGSYCSSYGTCEAPGTSSIVSNFLIQSLLSDLYTSADTLENWMYSYMDNIMQGEYDRQQWFETKMMDGWDTFWYYDLLPGLQSMTRQMNTNLAGQAYVVQADTDASQSMARGRELNKHEQDDRGVVGGGQMCVAATVAGGFTRTASIARDMRMAWERDSLAGGLNEKADAKGTPYAGATSNIGVDVKQYDEYLNLFCDPNANSGKNNCGGSTTLTPPLYNADVEPVKYIYNNLTIPVDKTDNPSQGNDVATAVYDIINNMVGIPSATPVSSGALSSVAGHEEWLTRRSYLARYAAIRSIPDLVASWRMPGSGKQLGQEVNDLRSEAHVSSGDISKDPSYREIMHAVSVDRFNSGKYALKMMTGKNELQMEKLNLSAFYLMQLRDYYALLERTALTLAVQVSILDEQKMSTAENVFESAPVK